VQALHGVSLTVGDGEMVAVLGPNGAGKTTTLRAVSGTVARRGEILYDGRGLPRSAERTARLGIGHVPEGRGTFSELTVLENLRLGAYTRRNGLGDDLDRVFAFFPWMRDRRDQPAGTLSGGEQQMLACARALLSNPELMLMDEPAEGLAPQRVRELGQVIETMRGDGLAILLVEQKMTFAVRHADYVYVLHKGRIGFEGKPEALLADRDAQERLLGVAPS
jgi:branched-chain amino acid transport system ATP-binding protein